jgi:putative Holliday junction resolvase
VIGVDLGLKKVGVSISDDSGTFARPLCVISFKGNKNLINSLAEIAREHDVSTFVVGLPKNMDGTIGESGRRSIKFARKLKAAMNATVILYDERLTSTQAEREMIGLRMSRKKRRMAIDEVASVLILENYLRFAMLHDKANNSEEKGK